MFRLLVQLDTRHAASREMITGIMCFAATHRDLEVQFSGIHPSNAPFESFRSWKPDALIADGSVHALSQRDFSVLSGKVIVFVNTPPRRNLHKPFARLTTDDRSLALSAARLFIGKKLPHLAFVGSPEDEQWSRARERLFRAALRDRGFRLNTFVSPAKSSWRDQENALAKWLVSLPKPCGVWVAYDQRAKHVLDACRFVGLNVPDQVQVLGVDNEPYICEQTIPSLSSVDPDFEAGGYAAVKFITDVLSGRPRPLREKLLFPVRGVVERLSTTDVNGRARHVALAREFIRRNATNGIGVREVAAAAGVSVRLLQKDYPSVTGTTVIKELIDTKLMRVKDLLRRTATPPAEIARLSGFASVSHLMTLFRKRTGMTMNEYRENIPIPAAVSATQTRYDSFTRPGAGMIQWGHDERSSQAPARLCGAPA